MRAATPGREEERLRASPWRSRCLGVAASAATPRPHSVMGKATASRSTS